MGLLGWLRGVGGASILLGGSGMLADPEYFWWSAVTIYLGIALLGADLTLVEPSIATLGPVVRALVVAAFAFAFAIFSFGIVFVSAPIGVMWTSMNAAYADGTVLSGIQWRREFAELNIWISNPTSRNYDEIDLVVKPDQPVAAIAHVSGCPDASFENAGGVSVTMGLFPGGQAQGARLNPLVLVATDMGYRVRCARLPRNTTMKLVLSIANMKPPQNPPPARRADGGVFDRDFWIKQSFANGTSTWFGHADGDVYTPRPNPTRTVTVSGSYVAAQRRRKVSLTAMRTP